VLEKNVAFLVTHNSFCHPLEIKLNKETLFQLSLFTLFGFSAIGAVLIVLGQGIDLRTVFRSGASLKWQVITGLLFGMAISAMGLVLVKLPFLQSVSDYFDDLFTRLELTIHDIVFYSFCAGVGEEMLFRGGFQPLFMQVPMPIFGIVITALVFVLAHGYINPRNWRMSLYGIYLIIASVGLGVLFYEWGIVSAIIAHFIYDLIMFAYLLFFKRRNSASRQIN